MPRLIKSYCKHALRFTNWPNNATPCDGQARPATGNSLTPSTSTQTALKSRSLKSFNKRLDLKTSCDNWLDSFRA
jgi:hypothetical protein